ncbi:hypothetical protein MRX96_035797 [Rhipicephalus microplus]
MSSEAARFSTELLISLVRQEPALWNQRSATYRNADARAGAWRRVISTLGLALTDENVKLAYNRWRNLRDTFSRKLREQKKKSGAGVVKATPKWKFFNLLLFLKDVTKPRPTQDLILPRHFAYFTEEISSIQVPDLPSCFGKVACLCTSHLHWRLCKKLTPMARPPLP